jgi:dephospho-CoA kinase
MGQMGRVIAVVGMAGSGKGTITDYLEIKGFAKVYFGGMVYEEVARRGLDIVENEKAVREDMRFLEGPAVLAKRAAQKADEHFAAGANTVIFDGLYSWSEFKFLNEKYGDDLLLLAVFTPRKERHQRVIARREGHRSYTAEQIQKRDWEEIENLEKGGPIAYANYTLLNSGSREELIESVDVLLQNLEIKI